MDVLEGVSSECFGLWHQDSLSGLDLDLAPVDLIHQSGFGCSASQLKGVKV